VGKGGLDLGSVLELLGLEIIFFINELSLNIPRRCGQATCADWALYEELSAIRDPRYHIDVCPKVFMSPVGLLNGYWHRFVYYPTFATKNLSDCTADLLLSILPTFYLFASYILQICLQIAASACHAENTSPQRCQRSFDSTTASACMGLVAGLLGSRASV
jgi:hypothetical protein